MVPIGLFMFFKNKMQNQKQANRNKYAIGEIAIMFSYLAAVSAALVGFLYFIFDFLIHRLFGRFPWYTLFWYYLSEQIFMLTKNQFPIKEN